MKRIKGLVVRSRSGGQSRDDDSHLFVGVPVLATTYVVNVGLVYPPRGQTKVTYRVFMFPPATASFVEQRD